MIALRAALELPMIGLFIEDDGPFCRECFDEKIENVVRAEPAGLRRKLDDKFA